MNCAIRRSPRLAVPNFAAFWRLHLDPARLDQRSAHERPLAMKLLPKDGMRCPAGRSGQIWITCPIGLLIGCSFILEEAINPESAKDAVRYPARLSLQRRSKSLFPDSRAIILYPTDNLG